MKHTALAIAFVAASTLGVAQPSNAMSLAAPSALKAAVPGQTTEVYWRGGWRGGWGGGWGWGPGLGFGLAAGALTAAALASGPYWGGYGYGYPRYAYAPGYAYDYAPGYSYGYGPAYAGYAAPGYAYSYGTTYVRPRVGYAYRSVGPRVGYGNTWGGTRYTSYRSGTRHYVGGSLRSARVSGRRH